MSEQKLNHFYSRTWAHVRRVQLNAQVLAESGCVDAAGLLKQVTAHDDSKFIEPEFSVYVEITWMHRCKRLGETFEMTDDLEQRMVEATLHHVKANRHHPEYWAPTASINPKDRDAPPGVLIDGSGMDDISLAEMCCDWVSMSQEKLGTNAAHEWARQNIGVRWGFDQAQTDRIYELLDTLQRNCEER